MASVPTVVRAIQVRGFQTPNPPPLENYQLTMCCRMGKLECMSFCSPAMLHTFVLASASLVRFLVCTDIDVGRRVPLHAMRCPPPQTRNPHIESQIIEHGQMG